MSSPMQCKCNAKAADGNRQRLFCSDTEKLLSMPAEEMKSVLTRQRKKQEIFRHFSAENNFTSTGASSIMVKISTKVENVA